MNPPVFHSFVVFSVINETGDVEPSFTQCNNCGVIHKITEVGISSILRKEDMPSLMTTEEIKTSLPENLLKTLQPYNLPLHVLQEIKFLLENELWGKYPIVLTKEEIDGITSGKYLLILGKDLHKINSFIREEFVNG